MASVKVWTILVKIVLAVSTQIGSDKSCSSCSLGLDKNSKLLRSLREDALGENDKEKLACTNELEYNIHFEDITLAPANGQKICFKCFLKYKTNPAFVDMLHHDERRKLVIYMPHTELDDIICNFRKAGCLDFPNGKNLKFKFNEKNELSMFVDDPKELNPDGSFKVHTKWKIRISMWSMILRADADKVSSTNADSGKSKEDTNINKDTVVSKETQEDRGGIYQKDSKPSSSAKISTKRAKEAHAKKLIKDEPLKVGDLKDPESISVPDKSTDSPSAKSQSQEQVSEPEPITVPNDTNAKNQEKRVSSKGITGPRTSSIKSSNTLINQGATWNKQTVILVFVLILIVIAVGCGAKIRHSRMKAKAKGSPRSFIDGKNQGIHTHAYSSHIVV